MSRAGYCSECNENVWLTEDGSCPNGHSSDAISGAYETDADKKNTTAPAVAKTTATEPIPTVPAKKSLLQNIWIVATIALVLGGCGGATIGMVAGSADGSAESDVDVAELENRITELESERDALLDQQDDVESSQDAAQQIVDLEQERDTLQGELTEAMTALEDAQAELNAADAVRAEEAAEEAATTFSNGVYLVGTDMPAGRYSGTVKAGVPYWSISSDANGSDIINNSLPSGPFYVEVSNGQFLELQDVVIALVD